MDNISKIKQRLREFANDRDWNQFHSPKNLVMALSVEASELLEHFQWLSEEESRDLDESKLAKIAEEIADVQIYLIRLSDVLQIDLMTVVEQKIEKNDKKYPTSSVRGSAKKYHEYLDRDEDNT